MIDGLKFAYFYVFPLLLSFTFFSLISLPPCLLYTHTITLFHKRLKTNKDKKDAKEA